MGSVEFSAFNWDMTGDVHAKTVPALTAAMATEINNGTGISGLFRCIQEERHLPTVAAINCRNLLVSPMPPSCSGS